MSGGTNVVRLRAASPFQTVYLSVIDDPLDGYWKLALSAATTDITVVVKLGPSIPENLFQTVFNVALGDSVGPPSSIANQVKTPTAVAVSGTSPGLGGAQQFTATVSFSDGSSQAATDQVSWQSSATNIAQVTSTGLVVGVAPGEADIRATYGTVSGSLRVTIASPGAGTFTVSGTVTDSFSGGRLPGVNVAIGSLTTTTDGTGNYSLTGIAGGSVTVVASASNYVTGQQAITLTGNVTVNFVLVRVPPTATVTIQNTPCRDNGNANFGPAPVTCSFVASSTNIPLPVLYSWTFQNADNGQILSPLPTGPQVSPTFDCAGFPPMGFATFTVNVILQASNGAAMATASRTTSITRAQRVCGAP